MSEEFDMDDYRKGVLDEIVCETRGNKHKSLEGLGVVEFLSRSNGKNRSRRPTREVSLLVYGSNAFQIKDNEIKPRKRGDIHPDSLAQEALEFLPADERTVDNLLSYARRKVK
jgi:hypothetical protein